MKISRSQNSAICFRKADPKPMCAFMHVCACVHVCVSVCVCLVCVCEEVWCTECVVYMWCVCVVCM